MAARFRILASAACALLLLPAPGAAMSLARVDVYAADGTSRRQGLIATPDGRRGMGRVWHAQDLLDELRSDSVGEARAIGASGTLRLTDSATLARALDRSTAGYDKIHFIYRTRFTEDEKEFMLVQALSWALLFGLFEIRHAEAYHWQVPLYGLAFGGALSFSLSVSRERRRVYLTWK